MKKRFFLFSIFIASQSYANETKFILIQGDNQSLDLSDIPLSPYQYDDLSFFAKSMNPQKELMSLLNNPEEILNFDKESIALDFDAP